MRFRSILIAAALSSVFATPALAHRQWLLPSTTTLSGTAGWVTVDAAVSNDLFYPDHVALDPTVVSVWAPDGSADKIQNPAKGRYRGTFDVAINKPGTWKIGIQRSSVSGTFMVAGEEWRVGGRRRPPMAAGAPGAPAGGPAGAPAPAAAPKFVETVADIPANATNLKLTESQSSNFIYVTSDNTTKVALTGKGLEFDPITHPAELASDEAAQFRFLIDGKPAAGVKVTLVPGSKKYREAELAQELTTDANGILNIKWPVAGMYWLEAEAEDNKPSEKRATTRRMTFVSTLEVVAP